MDVELTREQQELLRRIVVDGKYESAEAALAQALKLLELEAAWKADVRQKIQEGLDDVAAGRVVDGETAIEEILAELKRRSHRRKRA